MPFCEQLQLPAPLARALGDGDSFSQVMALQGEVFREVTNRRTLRFELAGRSYFAKLHFGVGWHEIFKNLLTLRLPTLSALTEWRAIARLNAIGIPTTPAVAYGCRGNSPASLRSFIITEDLGNIVSLETLCADWKINPPDPRLKRRLIIAVANIARIFHANGLNHRDFYLCHFCLDKPGLAQDEIHLYLIDLHRVGIRQHIRPAARIKDIAGLYFSALDAGLSKTDILRFIRAYRGSMRHALRHDQGFLQAIDVRARKLYEKIHKRRTSTPFDTASSV